MVPDETRALVMAMSVLALLLERRGVLDRTEFANLLELGGTFFEEQPEAKSPVAAALMRTLANGIRTEPPTELGPGWKPVTF
jgi:hypothetical protein